MSLTATRSIDGALASSYTAPRTLPSPASDATRRKAALWLRRLWGQSEAADAHAAAARWRVLDDHRVRR